MCEAVLVKSVNSAPFATSVPCPIPSGQWYRMAAKHFGLVHLRCLTALFLVSNSVKHDSQWDALTYKLARCTMLCAPAWYLRIDCNEAKASKHPAYGHWKISGLCGAPTGMPMAPKAPCWNLPKDCMSLTVACISNAHAVVLFRSAFHLLAGFCATCF